MPTALLILRQMLDLSAGILSPAISNATAALRAWWGSDESSSELGGWSGTPVSLHQRSNNNHKHAAANFTNIQGTLCA